MNIKIISICVIIIILFLGCTSNNESSNEKTTKNHKTKDVVMVVNIVDDTTMIQQYIDYHNHIWPEVTDEFRQAGFEKIKMYRYGRTVVIIITMPDDPNTAHDNKAERKSNPKVEEWNKLMATFQESIPGAPKDVKWVKMQQFFEYTK